GEEFGFERVRRILEDTSSAGSKAALVRIAAALDEFRGDAPQSDDLTMLAINLLPAPASQRAGGGARTAEAVPVDA
ncbi:MAG: hypothetical protein PHQ19_05785, partial [Candidatus Krumholzibacteria bacterium]|nr:hypothetical protein [Candidatus Krumholzibacteria bacterium]